MTVSTILNISRAILLCLIGLQGCNSSSPEKSIKKAKSGNGEQAVTLTSTKSNIDLACITPFVTRMNILYLGIGNPIEISVGGQPLGDAEITCMGAGCTIEGSTSPYIARVTSAGNVQVAVRHGEQTRSFNFRAKRIPDPIPSLIGAKPQASGQMSRKEFKAKKGVYASLLNHDIDTTCKILSYEINRISKEGERQRMHNSGGEYAGRTADHLIALTQSGDIYYYDNIKAKCPGDTVGRKLPPMVWQVK